MFWWSLSAICVLMLLCLFFPCKGLVWWRGGVWDQDVKVVFMWKPRPAYEEGIKRSVPAWSQRIGVEFQLIWYGSLAFNRVPYCFSVPSLLGAVWSVGCLCFTLNKCRSVLVLACCIVWELLFSCETFSSPWGFLHWCWAYNLSWVWICGSGTLLAEITF